MNYNQWIGPTLLTTGLLASAAAIRGCDSNRIEPLTAAKAKERIEGLAVLTDAEHEERRAYAIIINGSTDGDMLEDVVFAYNDLRRVGFQEENIFVLAEVAPRNDGPGLITAEAKPETVAIINNYLEQLVDENDLLLVYMASHGYKNENQFYLQGHGNKWSVFDMEIRGEKISLSVTLDPGLLEVRPLLDTYYDLSPGELVIVGNFCYSGIVTSHIEKRLAEDQNTRQVAAIASTTEDKRSYGWVFGRALFGQMGRSDEKVDTNNDGQNSLVELIDYTRTLHNGQPIEKEKESIVLNQVSSVSTLPVEYLVNPNN
ncbi:hypothetical protein HOA92_00880 [archaeon]|jgi:hypothetical protein|nr:hypothetical protein [archaeon]MBT6761572.1 hypothetical protein [archaeon]MBT7928369.1 hypothetical protein [Candidatus Peregrinibacteria bacterium]